MVELYKINSTDEVPDIYSDFGSEPLEPHTPPPNVHPQQNDTPKKKGMSTGAKVTIGLGVGAAFGAFIGIFAFKKIKNRKTKKDEGDIDAT